MQDIKPRHLTISAPVGARMNDLFETMHHQQQDYLFCLFFT